MRLEIDRGGRVVRRGMVALPAADAEGRIPYVAKVPVAALAPGEYTLRLSVTRASINGHRRGVSAGGGGEGAAGAVLHAAGAPAR